MARKPRIDHPGAWHHVGHRGLDRRAIHLDDSDRSTFCELLGDVLDRFGLETHTWCLMGNHYHLLVRSRDGLLSRAMRHLNGVYTQRFNRRHGRDGELLSGRFHSTRIDTDEYLAATSRYIHRNPIEAGIVDSPEQYQWSSYRGYLNAGDADPWLHRDEILARHGGSRIAHHRYVTDATIDPVAVLLGSDAPPEVLDATHAAGGPGRDRRPGRGAASPCPTTLDRVVAEAFQVDRTDLYQGSRGRPNAARMAAVHLAVTVGRMTQRDAADRYGYQRPTGVASALARFRAMLAADDALQVRLDTLIDSLVT